MDESRVELSVGDSIRVDDQILTVIDIHGDEITFRVDSASDFEIGASSCTLPGRLPPR